MVLNLFKERVKLSFDNAAIHYDFNSAVQFDVAQTLFNMILEHELDLKKVVDVGCGTGYLSSKLIAKFQNSQFILNDFAPNMLEIVHNKFLNHKNVSYHLADAEFANFSSNDIDLIVANLSMQWFTNPKLGIKNLWQQTECLAFSILISDTFKDWLKAHQKLKVKYLGSKYLSKSQLTDFCLKLSAGNATFLAQNIEVSFQDPIAFLNSLKAIGANSSNFKYSYTELKKLIQNFPHGLVTNYSIMHVIMKRR